MKCPKCGTHLASTATECGDCGWSKKPTAAAGPDLAAIAAAREESRKRALEDYSGPRACQERTCTARAERGKDLCGKHAAADPATIRRVGRPDWRSVGDIASREVQQ